MNDQYPRGAFLEAGIYLVFTRPWSCIIFTSHLGVFLVLERDLTLIYVLMRVRVSRLFLEGMYTSLVSTPSLSVFAYNAMYVVFVSFQRKVLIQ